MIGDTYSMTIAVMHSLDVGFNAGKGKILQNWTKEMSAGLIQQDKKQEIMTKRTLDFFDSLPKFSKEDK